MRNLKKIGAVLADNEEVMICPQCIKAKKPPEKCAGCRGTGFVNKDGSAITDKKAEFLGRVCANVEEIKKKETQAAASRPQ